MAKKAKPKLTLIESIDLAGETRMGRAVECAYIFRRIADGELCTKFPGDHFHSYHLDTIEAARASIREQLDSYVPPRDPAQVRAQATLDRWGSFVTKAERAVIVAMVGVDPRFNSLSGLEPMVDAIEKRAIDTLAKTPTTEPVHDLGMSDGEVADAIRLLTKLDLDGAKLRNLKGWNALDSRLGHWCCVMLADHPAEAIQTARGFVGNYQRQLQFGGVI